MRQKNSTFKFKKKRIKTFKIHEEKNQLYFDDYYSKIISEFFESNKPKEESKNNYINNANPKLKIANNVKLSSNSTNKIMKIKLNGNTKTHKKNSFDSNNNSNKERKTANINKKTTANIIQSISEKNIINKNWPKDISKSNTNINLNLFSLKTKKDSSNNSIKMSLNTNNSNNIQLPRQNPNYNRKERKNKSMDKRKEKNSKYIKDKKSINLKININDMFNYKKPSYQIKHYYKNNKTNINKNNNRKIIKNNKLHRSPDNLKVNINKDENSNIKDKNREIIKKNKKINTDANSSTRLFNLKKQKKILENSKNITDKNLKIKSLNKNLIDRKSTKNIYLNSSNSKINNAQNHQLTFKKIKVESIKIDLMNPPKNFSFISQEKLSTENPINDKNNLTLRGTEVPKFLDKINNMNKFTELSLLNPIDDSNLNRSFRTSFSLNKKSNSRSLSKKREEKKRLKLNNLENLNDIEVNQKKLNEILINLYNFKVIDTKEYIRVKKSEPKKLIDKIRKKKKLQNYE